MPIEATLYTLPHGRETTTEITKIHDKDADWFKANDAHISMEELRTGQFVLYADVGITLDDGETPDECIYTVPNGENAYTAFHNLRLQAEAKLQENHPDA